MTFHQTIVIGAGIAGLGCAARLRENGHEDVVVLEGSRRIGGRIASELVDGCRLDLGANWIHGTGSEDGDKGTNPLLRYVDRSRTTVFGDGHVFGGMDKDITSRFWQMHDDLEAYLQQLAHKPSEELSMSEAIARCADYTRKLHDRVPELQCLPQFLELKEAAPLLGEERMSLQEYATDEYSGDNLFLRDGYTPLLATIAKEIIESGGIRLDTKVTRIDWSGDRVRVTTSRGEYSARRVICTLPLGVLKTLDKGDLSFSPALPETKVDSIRKLGFGTLDKAFLIFDEPWWESEPYREIFGNSASLESFWGLSDTLQGSKVDEHGQWQRGPQSFSCLNLQSLTGFPVLSFFMSANAALSMETLTDEAVKDMMHGILCQWFAKMVPKPRRIRVTRWHADPFFNGSYSYVKMGSSASDREILAQPLVSAEGAQLRFAGEHTTANSYATAHGALLSGWREADAIDPRDEGQLHPLPVTGIKILLNDLEARLLLLHNLDGYAVEKHRLKSILGKVLADLREEVQRQRLQSSRTDQGQLSAQLSKLEKLWKGSTSDPGAQGRFSLSLARETARKRSNVSASGSQPSHGTRTSYKIIILSEANKTIFLDQCDHCIYMLDEASTTHPTVHATNCSQCIFVGAFHQLRIHHSTQCGIWAPSSVLEHCTDFRIGPGSQLKDFNWLQGGPSPNWAYSDVTAEQISAQIRARSDTDDNIQFIDTILRHILLASQPVSL